MKFTYFDLTWEGFENPENPGNPTLVCGDFKIVFNRTRSIYQVWYNDTYLCSTHNSDIAKSYVAGFIKGMSFETTTMEQKELDLNWIQVENPEVPNKPTLLCGEFKITYEKNLSIYYLWFDKDFIAEFYNLDNAKEYAAHTLKILYLKPIETKKRQLTTTPEPDNPIQSNSTKEQITQVCNKLEAMLIAKNLSYGDSALNPIRIFSKALPTEGIRIRIDDKLNRIMNQKSFEVEDTLLDLIGYLILLYIAEKQDLERNVKDVPTL